MEDAEKTKASFFRVTKACGEDHALIEPLFHPPEQPPLGEVATLQPLLQDILHILPTLTGTAATPVDSAEGTPAPLHCGRTKVFMTDFMVSWSGDEIMLASCGLSTAGQSGPSLGQWEERLRTSMDAPLSS